MVFDVEQIDSALSLLRYGCRLGRSAWKHRTRIKSTLLAWFERGIGRIPRGIRQESRETWQAYVNTPLPSRAALTAWGLNVAAVVVLDIVTGGVPPLLMAYPAVGLGLGVAYAVYAGTRRAFNKDWKSLASDPLPVRVAITAYALNFSAAIFWDYLTGSTPPFAVLIYPVMGFPLVLAGAAYLSGRQTLRVVKKLAATG